MLNNRSINSSKADEKRSCWAVVRIDGFETDAKIVHTSGTIFRFNYLGFLP
jgi:hypothetical protein